MVYCGKPSTGCQNCKSRRIKCDEARPHCLNCIRTRRICPGFPSQVDLMFRKENPGVPRKIRRTLSKAEQSFNLNPYTDEDDDDYEQSSSSTTLKRKRSNTHMSNASHDDHSTILHFDHLQRFSPSIEEQATTSFLQNYVFSHQRAHPTQGYLDVVAMLFNQATHDSPLYLAIEAVAISVLATTPEQQNWSQLAARSYGRALAATSTAIQDPREATSDATLLSILLFSLYESLTTSDQSFSASAKHIEGAVAITKARGIKQFSDPQSLLLFRSVRTQMLSNAVRQRKPIDDFPGPQGWLSDLPEHRSSGAKLIASSLSLPNLLSAAEIHLASDPTPDTTAEVSLLLEQALEIQHAFSQWEVFMPLSWAHSVGGISHGFDANNTEDVEAWPGPMYWYQDLQVAGIRNNHRVDQLFCSSTIIAAIRWLHPQTYPSDLRYVAASDRVQSLVDEICWSVPFVFQPDMFGEEARADSSPSGISSFGTHLLAWPLYAASCMEDISPLQRTWLQGRLNAIHTRSGTASSRKSSSASPGRGSGKGVQHDRSYRNSSSGSSTAIISPQVQQPHDLLRPKQQDRRDSISPMDSLAAPTKAPSRYNADDAFARTMAIDPALLGLTDALSERHSLDGTGYDDVVDTLEQTGWPGSMETPCY